MSRLTDAYFRYLDAHLPEDEWAWLEVDHFDSPQVVWPVILDLVEAAPNSDALAYIGAGPLEDLILKYGGILVDDLEKEGRLRPRLVEALRNSWLEDADHEVAARLSALLAM